MVTDVGLPGLDGVGLLARLHRVDPDLPVILITGHGDIGMAAVAMPGGAYDFLAKPYPAEALITLVRRALERRRLVMENRTLRARLDGAIEEDPAFLGASPEIAGLRALLREVAKADVDVLVFGETGSGKEVVAGALHRWSRRAERKLVAMNCGALGAGAGAACRKAVRGPVRKLLSVADAPAPPSPHAPLLHRSARRN